MNILTQKTLDSKGFTLVELLVTLAMASLVLLLVGQMFISTNKMNTIQDKVASIQQNIRGSMEMMSRDIMMVGLDPTKTAVNPGFANEGADTSDTDVNSVTIRYDYDGDGTCEVDRSYYYDLGNQTFMVNDNTVSPAAPQELTETGTISSVAFNYLLSTGSTTSAPTATDLNQIRQVIVTVCGKITGVFAAEHNVSYCFSNNIRPRNM